MTDFKLLYIAFLAMLSGLADKLDGLFHSFVPAEDVLTKERPWELEEENLDECSCEDNYTPVSLQFEKGEI